MANLQVNQLFTMFLLTLLCMYGITHNDKRHDAWTVVLSIHHIVNLARGLSHGA